ncbi:MAG: sulfatase-like hydrolase/transferase [Verrucomicrobiota bacterium]|nr:sulfatase-like hydrolase/transferase [Verrucomicrobiota bacterium]
MKTFVLLMHLALCTVVASPVARPNILILLVDELRYPAVYEDEALRKWSSEHLKTMAFLREHGVNFDHHYIGSTACAPSRATLFTGQYPTRHGVSQTDGIAKPAYDPTMFWLSPHTVPTAGNFFTEGLYATWYIGKWHISSDNLYDPGTQTPVPTYHTITGIPDPHLEKVYRSANRLAPFGFANGWIGPEPHGTSPHLSGASAATEVPGRDPFFADETIALLQKLNAQETPSKPWFIVCSFVNPHDITLYGDITKQLPLFDFTVDPTLPPIPQAPTANEDLRKKPTAQRSYKEEYQKAFQPTTDTEEYRKLYYTLQKKVDGEMGRVLTALQATQFKDNTIVVFTSDHGDLLGAHSNFQKWFNMYEESIHVPLIFYSPTLLPQGKHVDLITSHIDLLPTLCGLAHIDANAVTQTLQETFTNSSPLVGRDLSEVVLAEASSDKIASLEEPALFLTYDQIFTGSHSVSRTGTPYTYVDQPAFIHAIITRLNGEIWKYAIYFANRTFTNAPLPCSCSTPIPEDVPPQYEMYNLSKDPLEINNVTGTPAYRKVEKKLRRLLRKQVESKAFVTP